MLFNSDLVIDVMDKLLLSCHKQDMSTPTLTIKRYDSNSNRSLRPWSAADEFLLQWYNDNADAVTGHLAIYNDRFGYLSCHLYKDKPTVVLTHKSQEKAINLNVAGNTLPPLSFSDPLSKMEKSIDLVIVKIPKAIELFRLFLEQIVQNSNPGVKVVCGFMTRQFNAQLLEVAAEYFEEVMQSKAQKKSRLLILSKKKTPESKDLLKTIEYNEQSYKQYPGVFSGKHIDYGTQFLLQHLDLKDSDGCILDLASGNGVIAKEILAKSPTAEIHLVDDSFLAVKSAEINIQGNKITHHQENNLSIFEDEKFDLIVSNPPFHFEYEINISVSLALFAESYRCLKKDGSFQLVANHHLNYKTHLSRLFGHVNIVAEDEKFVVYKCFK